MPGVATCATSVSQSQRFRRSVVNRHQPAHNPFHHHQQPTGRPQTQARTKPVLPPPSPLAPPPPPIYLRWCGLSFSSRLGRRESAWTCYNPPPLQGDQNSPLFNWTMCIKSRRSCLTNHLYGIWKGFSQLDSQEDKLDINLPRDSIRMTFSY